VIPYKPKMRWFLKAELGVLVCILCICVIKLVTADIDSTKAAVLKEAVTIRSNSAEVSDKTREFPTNFSETFGLVTGICYSSDKPSAVINNKIVVYEGDTIDGVTIVKIYKDKVEFTKNGKNCVQEIIRYP